MTAPTFELAQAILAAQPFSELIGARLTEFGDGVAVLEIDIDDRLRQQVGLVHGGVLAYGVDNALTFAAGSVLGPEILTSGISVRYLHGARDGVLRATARVDHHGRKQAICSVRVEVIDEDGGVLLCALGTGEARVTTVD